MQKLVEQIAEMSNRQETATQKRRHLMNRQLNALTLIVATVVLVALTGAAQAAFIVQPSDVDASSEFGQDRLAIDAIDGSGFTVTEQNLVTTDSSIPGTWPDHADDSKISWLSGNTTPSDEWITFDLGEKYELTGMRVWNYNAGTGFTDRGINALYIEFSTTGSDLSSASGFSKVGDFTFTEATGFDDYTGEDYMLSGQARFVRFSIESNHGASPAYVGLSEVRFTASAVIPEPASLVLLALGSLALFRRPRRRK